MKQYISIVFVFLLVLVATACAPAAAITTESAPTGQLARAEPYHPLTTKTGIQIIDQIVHAVASSDPEALRALIEFTNAECTRQDGLGGPPKCREGEVEGTLVEVLAFLSSEGSYLHREEIDRWTGVQASGVYAVYEVNAAAIPSEKYFPAGKYVILLVDEENQTAVALRIGERGIIRVDEVFDFSPEALHAMVLREASTVVLPPKS